MLATIGLLLVIGGLMVVPSPAIATRRGWLPTQDVDAKAAMAPRPMPLGRAWAYPSAQASSSQESIKGGSRWMSRRVSSVIPAPTKTRMPDALEPASSTCRPLRHDSDDRIANALFPDGIEPSVPGIVRSDLQQQVRNPRSCIGTGADSTQKAELPLCEDPRVALAMMASAQRRGTETRWDETVAAVVVRVTGDDRIASELAIPSPTHGSESFRSDEHVPDPSSLERGWDVRWSFSE
jgi:hypothetical protein